jgi:hypothetical protein
MITSCKALVLDTTFGKERGFSTGLRQRREVAHV